MKNASTRNVSIAWNHPAQYGVYGIQHESTLAEDTARGGPFGEAGRMVSKKGGAAFRIHPQRGGEVVQERRNRRLETDRNTIVETKDIASSVVAGHRCRHHQEARWPKKVWPSDPSRIVGRRNIRVALFSSADIEALPSFERALAMEAAARLRAETGRNARGGFVAVRYGALRAAGRFEAVRVHAHRPVQPLGIRGSVRETSCIQKRLIHCASAEKSTVPVPNDPD